MYKRTKLFTASGPFPLHPANDTGFDVKSVISRTVAIKIEIETLMRFIRKNKNKHTREHENQLDNIPSTFARKLLGDSIETTYEPIDKIYRYKRIDINGMRQEVTLENLQQVSRCLKAQL